MTLNLILFFVYSLLFTSGTATLVVGVLILRKLPLSVLKLFFCFWIALSLAVFSNVFHFYVRGIAELQVSIYHTLAVSGIALFCSLSIFFFFRTMLAFFGSRSRIGFLFSWLMLAVSVAVSVIPFFQTRDQSVVYFDFRMEWYVIPVILFFFIGGMAVWMLRRKKVLTDPLRRKLFRPLWIMLVLFWAVMTLDVTVGIANSVLDGMPFFFLYYFSWNVLSLVYAFSFLLKKGSSQGLVTEATEEFIREYGLTDREAEVASAIAKARSNKEIAFEMGISYDTVRSHVYNLFRKTGVRSRTELIRKLNPVVRS